MRNANMNKAKVAKQDEFYTRLEDIEAELCNGGYKEQFEGKVVYMNCDDPAWSEFWQFFVRNFKDWKIKKLLATHYDPDEANYSYKLELTEDTNGDGRIDWNDEPTKTQITCNGDFRSAACIELLKEADIVVTNPPFSLFRDYIAQLMEYEKKFVVIGSMNAITYKEIFPLLKENKLWTGNKHYGGGMNMIVPSAIFDKSKVKNYRVDDEGRFIVNIMGVIWFTNLDIAKRHIPLDLRGHYYTPDKYPTYINYDAIEVGKVVDIPCDYEGMMGVPITFLDSYNPDQFEIIGNSASLGKPISHFIKKGNYQPGGMRFYLDEPYKGYPTHRMYDRLVICNKDPKPRRYPDAN